MPSPEKDILIRNASVINADAAFESDILISNGRISRLAKGIAGDQENKLQVLDAAGKIVFPGGIDPHVHFRLLTAAGYSADDFSSGSRAALAGGTTTIIDFVTPTRGSSLTDALQQRLKEAATSVIDYSFHVSPVEWRTTTPREIKQCVENGIPSFKVYMAYKEAIGLDESTLERVMRTVAGEGGMVAIHCELGEEIEALRTQLANNGELSPDAHARSRPPHTESLAVEKAVRLADQTKCPLYIVHVSTRESVAIISQARTRGQLVWGEVCPHHLLLDVACYDKAFEYAAPCVLSPPLRSQPHRKALWNGLSGNSLQTVGTDHCPFYMEQKEAGRHDFRKIANGAGGIEHRLSLLYTFGVLTGKINMHQFVNLVSTSAAKIFGLYPRKGVIAEGADADMVIWDPEVNATITAATHHQRSDVNIYEGIRTKGKAVTVIAGGQVACSNNTITPGLQGRFLRRPVEKFTD